MTLSRYLSYTPVVPRVLGMLLGLLLQAATADAAPCRGGRYLVREGGLVVGSAGRETSAVNFRRNRLELEDICGPTKNTVSGTRQRTRLSARWKRCPGLGDGVRLRARIDDCTELRGTLRVRQPSMRVQLVASRTRCGDGVLDGVAGELCDDGGTVPGDGCSAFCQIERCGDGFRQGAEACDDGNGTDDDGCSAACRFEQCGDGVVQATEECDDGNADHLDGCSNRCERPRCGNGLLEPGEACDGFDTGGANCISVGAQGGSLGCRADCTLAPETCVTCGDGQHEDFEACDGDDLAGETCESRGYPEGGTLACGPGCLSFDARGCFFCGDGIKEGPEQCDGGDLGGAICDAPGETGGPLACTSGCRVRRDFCWRCGNGRIDPGEACDTGERLGDPDLGCSTTCTGLCGDGVVAVTEFCDDGNTANGDGCDRRCFLEETYDGGGHDLEEFCMVEWGASGTIAGGIVECRDGATCNALPGMSGCTMRYFVCFNSGIVLGPPGLPCTRPSIATVALSDASLMGPTALEPLDQDGFLDMVEHVLGRQASVSRNDTSVTASPAASHFGSCGGATVSVPAGSERVIATVTTSGGSSPSTDTDRLRFRCLE